MKSCIVFDVDGTLADNSQRHHLIAQRPKQWDEYFKLCGNDKPIMPVVEILFAFNYAGIFPLMCVSARPLWTKEITLEWFNKYDLPEFNDYYFRPNNDYREDSIVKQEILGRMRADGYDPFLVFDDRQRVVDMWRANGIVCAQVAPGNF